MLVVALLAACSSATPSPARTVPGATAPPSSPPAPTRTPGPTPIPNPTALPLGDRILATLTVDQAPCALAADATSVWVTSNATGLLDRIDPATNTVSEHIPAGTGPCGVAVGADGRIWVADLGLTVGAVLAIDPATSTVTSRIEHVGPALWDLKAGFGSIWVVDRTAKQVLRIDPKTATVVASIDVGPQASGLAVMPAGVWVSDDTDGSIRRIDPATNTVVETVAIGGAPSWFADDGAAHLLIATRGSGTVTVVDPATGVAGSSLKGLLQPLDGTVIGTQAWIPDGSRRWVVAIDLSAASLAGIPYSLPGALNPFVAEPAFGDVWVLDFGGTTIWRIRA